ncbi:Gfo/Idh/MocA family oxidoreductase [bacterium]|nr:Gfo/Idh/MocA family oxidoreductase [bacterium]
MSDCFTNHTFSRRKYLGTAGIAGLGAFALSNDQAHAVTGPVLPARFDYSFRTYRSGEVIKIGMIGTTGHTATIIDDIPQVPGTELAAYAVYDNPGLKIPAGTRIYDTYEEMLEKEQLDIVGICLPYHQNARASIAAAKKGIHIMSEKPVATTIGDLDELLGAVIKHKVRLTALLSMRMEPQFRAVHDAIAEGKIGEPILATAQKSYKFGESRPDFYKDGILYGGTIPWVGIHAIDYIHYTTQMNYTRVAAFQGNKDHPDYPGCEDYAGVLLGMRNGGTAMINMDYLRPETAPTHGDDRLRVIGSEGVVEIKDLATRVELITTSQKPYDIPLPERKSFFADFIAELRGQGKHVIAPEEPFEMTRVSLLARQAADENAIIRLA